MQDENFWCDFGRNETLSVEKIVRSAFLNPERHAYPEKWADKQIFQEADSADWFISKANVEMPIALKNFDAGQNKLLDTSRLFSGVSKENWVEKIKDSRWYGPYVHKNFPQYFLFFTVTSSGVFDGLKLVLDFKEKSVMLFYQNHERIPLGHTKKFPNAN